MAEHAPKPQAQTQTKAQPAPIDGSDFVARAKNVFGSDLIQPMFLRAAQNPDDVRKVVAFMREKLDQLDGLLAAIPSGQASPVQDASPSAPQPQSNGHLMNGADGAGDAFDDIGRNQRSRLRELTLLEYIARENRPFSLQQILGALHAKGFDDSSGAVVSQLHRLKKTGAIDQPAGGMYAVTDDGLSHLRKLRSSFGPLIGDARS